MIAASILVSPVRQSTRTVTQTETQIEPCNGQLVWSVNSNLTGVPVLLMQPNSTAYVCVTYQSSWHGDPASFPSQPFANDTYRFGLTITKEQCTTAAGVTACTGTASHSFVISAFPSSIKPTGSTNFISVLYTITALGNSTGFYDDSAPFEYCEGMPMAVGYAASQVNASDFAPRIIHPCAIQFFPPYSVSVTGMSFAYIHFP